MGLPKSKSKRRRYQAPPKPKPPPSPRWVPIVFFSCMGIGFVVIIARYAFAATFPALDQNWILWVGLAMMAAAFGVATRWH